MKVIQISRLDNVAVALHPIKKGEEVTAGGITVTALEDIPQGHKIALKPIKNGENIIKYGFAIGHATADAEAGAWMHTHNVKTNLEGEMEYTYTPSLNFPEKVEPETFMGFRRKDGRAAIRNEIWIIPTVGCVNDIAKKMVRDNQDLVKGTIDGLYTFPHPFGCSQTGADHAQTRKLLAALVRHPNAAAVLVLGLGCENLTHEQFLEELGDYDHDRVKFLTCQEVDDEFEAGRKLLEECSAYAAQFEREPIPVSELVVGMKLAEDCCVALCGRKKVVFDYNGWSTGSSDFGDVTCVMPGVQINAGGAVGTLHGIDFQITDPNRMCVNAAKVQLFLVDALLSNNAVAAKEIIANYKPQYPSIKAYLDAIDALTLDKDAVRYDEKGNAIVDFQN